MKNIDNKVAVSPSCPTTGSAAGVEENATAVQLLREMRAPKSTEEIEEQRHTYSMISSAARDNKNAEREFALIEALNNLAFTLREIAEYYIPESHPDFQLALDEIQQAEETVKGLVA